MDQLAAAYLLADDRSLLEQRREVLREQRAVLLGAVAEHLPDWRPTIGSGGMSVWMRMSAPVSTALAAVAPNFGVLLAAAPVSASKVRSNDSFACRTHVLPRTSFAALRPSPLRTTLSRRIATRQTNEWSSSENWVHTLKAV
ncbi:hypothetical protein GCM10020255_058940 [Rhodococcus baikonurensis]